MSVSNHNKLTALVLIINLLNLKIVYDQFLCHFADLTLFTLLQSLQMVQSSCLLKLNSGWLAHLLKDSTQTMQRQHDKRLVFLILNQLSQ